VISRDKKNGHVEGVKLAEDLTTYSAWRYRRRDVATSKLIRSIMINQDEN
jgi:hypothetical protein